MSDAPEPLPEPWPDHWSAPLAQRQLQRLDELAEIGLDCARAISRQAQAGEPEVADLALAYSRVSRAVRLTLLLQSRIIDALKAAERDAATAEAHARQRPIDQRKARVERIVERLAEAEHPDDEDAIDDIVCEANERLDDEDYADILERPFEEIVARICQDLGLHPTSPMRSMVGGGPSAKEPMVEGEGLRRDSLPYTLRDSSWWSAAKPPAPSTIGSSLRSADGPPPAASGGGDRESRPPPPPTPSAPAPMPDWF